MKFVKVFALTLVSMIVMSSTVFALSHEELEKKYNLERKVDNSFDLDKAPKFNNIDEADAFLNKLREDINKTEICYEYIPLRTQGRYDWKYDISSAKLNITAYFNYSWDGNRRRNVYDNVFNCTSVLTGFTGGLMRWEQTGFTSNIKNDGGYYSSLYVTVNGKLTIQLFVGGIGDIYSDKASYTVGKHGSP